MTLELVTTLLHDTIRISLMLSAPVLATAMVTGLVISVLQAATQVNEQTLSFVPKIVLTLLMFALVFPWVMTTLVDFGQEIMAEVSRRGVS